MVNNSFLFIPISSSLPSLLFCSVLFVCSSFGGGLEEMRRLGLGGEHGMVILGIEEFAAAKMAATSFFFIFFPPSLLL
jgi:hypothetical protein